jgi:hypothetical protein
MLFHGIVPSLSCLAAHFFSFFFGTQSVAFLRSRAEMHVRLFWRQRLVQLRARSSPQDQNILSASLMLIEVKPPDFCDSSNAVFGLPPWQQSYSAAHDDQPLRALENNFRLVHGIAPAWKAPVIGLVTARRSSCEMKASCFAGHRRVATGPNGDISSSRRFAVLR